MQKQVTRLYNLPGLGLPYVRAEHRRHSITTHALCMPRAQLHDGYPTTQPHAHAHQPQPMLRGHERNWWGVIIELLEASDTQSVIRLFNCLGRVVIVCAIQARLSVVWFANLQNQVQTRTAPEVQVRGAANG